MLRVNDLIIVNIDTDGAPSTVFYIVTVNSGSVVTIAAFTAWSPALWSGAVKVFCVDRSGLHKKMQVTSILKKGISYGFIRYWFVFARIGAY